MYNLILAVVTAVVIVMAMNLVGSLLISALVIFPAMSAMRLFKSFRAVTFCAAVLSVFCAAAGDPYLHPGRHTGGVHHCCRANCIVCPLLPCRMDRKEMTDETKIDFAPGRMLLLTCSACGKKEGSWQAESLAPPVVSQQAEAAPEHVPSAESEVSGKEPLPAEGGDGQGDSRYSRLSVPRWKKKRRIRLRICSRILQEAPAVSVDVDLTTLSSTMVYAEVFNMMMSPDDYIGRTIRMTGIFTVYQDPETKQVYCGVIVEDATACCAQGFDLVMPEERSYPQDYPAPESEITVVGTLQADRTLEEHGIIFLRLEDVTFE